MKITADRDPLLDALQSASRALSTRSTLPSLGGILLTAEGGTATARATDMELALSVGIDAQVEGDGTILLPGRLLTDVARALPPGPVTIAERPAERDVELTAGTARFHLRVLPTEDFPRLPTFEGEPIRMPAAALAETVERVARAASRDEVRPILTGILVSVEERPLTMVATDSYRLSVKHTTLGSAPSEAFEANVPARALRELARIVSATGVEEVEIAMPGNQIIFRAGRLRALLAADRRPVPELPPAAAGRLRPRRPPAEGGAARRDEADPPPRPAQRAAAARLQRRRADRLGGDAGDR